LVELIVAVLDVPEPSICCNGVHDPD
jgi:hypothetical protein